MFSMSAGQLRQVVVIEQRLTSQDGAGQQSTTWAYAGTVRAKVEPYQAKEQVQANQHQAEVSQRVTIRFRKEFADPQTAALYRLTLSGRKFNINGSINLEERNIWLQLLCSEGRSDG